jgi:diacylglycerol kinase family enzyme
VHRQYQHQPQMKFWLVRNSIVVRTHQPLTVQADGECIGDTPVQVRVVPAALRVIAASSNSPIQ